MLEGIDIQNLSWLDEANTTVIATINGAVSSVPADMSNRHYKYIVDNALAIAPYAYVAPDFDAVSRYQFMKQAKASAQFATIKAWYDGLADDDEAKLELQYKQFINKDGAFVTGVKALLGLSDAQVQTFMNNAAAVSE